MARSRIAKVLEETEKGRLRIGFVSLTNVCIAIVISRNGKNQSSIVLIGLIELLFVQPLLPVEVDQVPENIEERGLICRLRCC